MGAVGGDGNLLKIDLRDTRGGIEDLYAHKATEIVEKQAHHAVRLVLEAAVCHHGAGAAGKRVVVAVALLRFEDNPDIAILQDIASIVGEKGDIPSVERDLGSFFHFENGINLFILTVDSLCATGTKPGLEIISVAHLVERDGVVFFPVHKMLIHQTGLGGIAGIGSLRGGQNLEVADGFLTACGEACYEEHRRQYAHKRKMFSIHIDVFDMLHN